MWGPTRWTAAAPSSALPASTDPGAAATATGRAIPIRPRRTRTRATPPTATQLPLDVVTAEPDVGALRDYVRALARNVPGVYLMRGARGEVLYVGKSTQLRTRLLSYFRLPWPEHRHARMLRETLRIEWEEQPSEFAALLREVRLIRAHLPRYNVRSARPLNRWWVITIGDGPAPRLRVQRASAALQRRGAGPGTVIGPFSSRAPLVEALRVLNDALGLRDCADRVRLVLRDAGDLFDSAEYPELVRTPGCHRYETRRCLGPCVSACSAGEYRTQLLRARAVLEGVDDAPQQALAQEMRAASAALSYERAGWLRDRLAALQLLEEQLARVRESLHRHHGVYQVPGRDGDHRAYLIQHGRVVSEARCADEDAMAHLSRRAARPAPTPSGIAPEHLDEMVLLEHWFRTRPDAAESLRPAGPGEADPRQTDRAGRAVE